MADTKPEATELPRWLATELKTAETAFHKGDAAPRRSLWSRQEPVSVMGAWRNAVGQSQIDALFNYLAVAFSDCSRFELEVLACDVNGDGRLPSGGPSLMLVHDRPWR